MQNRDKNGKFEPAIPWWREPHQSLCFFDIETTGFTGNNDYMICWAVLGENDTKVATDNITTEEVVKGSLDKRITKSLWHELNKYTAIVTYNGIMFDAKMFRTRCFAHGIRPFIGATEKRHIDLYWRVKTIFNLSRSSLAVATKFLDIPGKTPLDFSYWKRAAIGDKKSMRELLVHNRGDVEILRDLFWKLEPYSKFPKKVF